MTALRPIDTRKGVYRTPRWLFEPLNARHQFDLDAAASKENALCKRYFDESRDALKRSWRARCYWLNSPYGQKPTTGTWVAHARAQVELSYSRSGCLLVPVKAETGWWQDCVRGRNRVVASRKVTVGALAGCWFRLREARWDVEVLELRRRVPFEGGRNGFFASALVFFNPGPGPALLFD